MTKKKQRASGAQHADPSGAQHRNSFKPPRPTDGGFNNEVTGRQSSEIANS
jgi:hypothetical protein